MRWSNIARSLVDAARWSTSQDTATAWVIEGVQRRLATVDELRHELLRAGRQHTARARRAVDAAATGAWSLPEAELIDIVEGSRVLPQVWANPILTTDAGLPLVTPDGWLDDVGMAIMVHSRAHHEGGEQWDLTVAKDGELTALGVVVVGVTPHAIRRRPKELLDRLERTWETHTTDHARQSWRGGASAWTGRVSTIAPRPADAAPATHR